MTSPSFIGSTIHIEKDEEIALQYEDTGLLRLLLAEARQSSSGQIVVRKCEEVLNMRKRRKTFTDEGRKTGRKRRRVSANEDYYENDNVEEDEMDEDAVATMFAAAAHFPVADPFEPVKRQIAKIKNHPGILDIAPSVALSLQKLSGVIDHARLDNEVKNLTDAERMSKLYKAMTFLLYRNLRGDSPTCRRWHNVKDAIGSLCVVAFWDEPGLVEMNNTQLGLLKKWWEANYVDLPIVRLEATWIKLLVSIREKNQRAVPELLQYLRNPH